jgi:hypothetical protein
MAEYPSNIRKVTNKKRAERLMRSVISDLELDLTDITVLTEAASGPFAVTPLIAGLAGSPHIVAIAKDSPYGTALEVINYIQAWAIELGINDRIEFSTQPSHSFAPSTNIITNLGFVRPINNQVVEKLPKDSVIAFMREPWEFRDEDIEIKACQKNRVTVLGTDESHPRLQIFRYIGILALKLLLETDLEIVGSRILILSSDPFGDEVEKTLKANNATVLRIKPIEGWETNISEIKESLTNIDAVVVAEYKKNIPLISEKQGLPISWLAEYNIPVMHICGSVDSNALASMGVIKNPSRNVPNGFMTLTTDYVGPRPVIDLHSGSLKACEIFVRNIREGSNPETAITKAVESGLAIQFERS